jgi:hypothetical protein
MPVENASTAVRQPQLLATPRVGKHLLEMRAKQITTSPNRKAVPTTKVIWSMLAEIATVQGGRATPTRPTLMTQLVKNGGYLEWKTTLRRNDY